jgi:regulatory protein
MAMRPERKPPTPLDAAALERLALRYVERFATTKGKLADYLVRKVRERGWDGGEPADPDAVAARMAALGYVDDRLWAEAKAAALTRRGLGGGRVALALRQARVAEADAEAARAGVSGAAVDSALAFARRRRIGPWSAVEADRAQREKHIAAMIRAGHGFALARTIASARPGIMPQIDTEMNSDCCDESEPC